MNGTKSPFKSKGVLGGVAALLAGGGGFLGYTISADDITSGFLLAQSIASSVGGLLAIYGRIKASKRIG